MNKDFDLCRTLSSIEQEAVKDPDHEVWFVISVKDTECVKYAMVTNGAEFRYLKPGPEPATYDLGDVCDLHIDAKKEIRDVIARYCEKV